MQIKYTVTASDSLAQLIAFIENTNTLGSGLRWLNKYELFMNEALLISVNHKICNNLSLKSFGLNCLYFNDWLIAYSIHQNFILIEALLHKSRISD